MSEHSTGPDQPVVVPIATKVFPPGADPNRLAHGLFALTVEWCGRGNWRVTRGNGQEELSRNGKWTLDPAPAQTSRHRFGAYEDALAAAVAAVPHVNLDGITWDQFTDVRTGRGVR